MIQHIETNIFFQDTSVRWSAAKGIARISHRLPLPYVEQVLDNLLEFYSAYGMSTPPTELPVTAELSWHGATLAFAELARKNLVPARRLREVMTWMFKAWLDDECHQFHVLIYPNRRHCFSTYAKVRLQLAQTYVMRPPMSFGLWLEWRMSMR